MPAVTAPKRFKVSIFVRGDSKRYNLDPIVVEKHSAYVAYQNATQPTGTGGKSTIVEYNGRGKAVHQIELKGRCDGMRWDPRSGDIAHYDFSSAKHGGGYDDLAFTGNKAFIAA